jgi:hypothetical protein
MRRAASNSAERRHGLRAQRIVPDVDPQRGTFREALEAPRQSDRAQSSREARRIGRGCGQQLQHGRDRRGHVGHLVRPP